MRGDRITGIGQTIKALEGGKEALRDGRFSVGPLWLAGLEVKLPRPREDHAAHACVAAVRPNTETSADGLESSMRVELGGGGGRGDNERMEEAVLPMAEEDLRGSLNQVSQIHGIERRHRR